MLIHHELIKSTNPIADTKPITVLIHGLFGEGKNLKILSDALNQSLHILVVDLRNHGRSLHADVHDYEHMANDIITLLVALNINSINLIGHSMGGKVAMMLADSRTVNINKIIVLDIAPVKYTQRKHDDVFLGLNQVILNGCTTRLDASKVMAQYINTPAIIQFLLKSFDKGKWRFNLSVLEKNYEKILDWNGINKSDIPILFLIGGNSDYVLPEHKQFIIDQFPNSKAHIIAGADHWVHADKPEQVLKQIHKFLD